MIADRLGFIEVLGLTTARVASVLVALRVGYDLIVATNAKPARVTSPRYGLPR